MDPALFPAEPDFGVPVYPCPVGVDPHRPFTPGTSVEMLMRPEPTTPTLSAGISVAMRQLLGDVPEIVPATATVTGDDGSLSTVDVDAESNLNDLGYLLPPCSAVFVPGVFRDELPDMVGMNLWSDAPLGTVFHATDGSGYLVRSSEETVTGQHPVWVPLHGADDLSADQMSELLYHRSGDLTGLFA